MKKYTIYLQADEIITHYQRVEVEANSEDDAKQIAIDQYNDVWDWPECDNYIDEITTEIEDIKEVDE